MQEERPKITSNGCRWHKEMPSKIYFAQLPLVETSENHSPSELYQERLVSPSSSSSWTSLSSAPSLTDLDTSSSPLRKRGFGEWHLGLTCHAICVSWAHIWFEVIEKEHGIKDDVRITNKKDSIYTHFIPLVPSMFLKPISWRSLELPLERETSTNKPDRSHSNFKCSSSSWGATTDKINTHFKAQNYPWTSTSEKLILINTMRMCCMIPSCMKLILGIPQWYSATRNRGR